MVLCFSHLHFLIAELMTGLHSCVELESESFIRFRFQSSIFHLRFRFTSDYSVSGSTQIRYRLIQFRFGCHGLSLSGSILQLLRYWPISRSHRSRNASVDQCQPNVQPFSYWLSIVCLVIFILEWTKLVCTPASTALLSGTVSRLGTGISVRRRYQRG